MAALEEKAWPRLLEEEELLGGEDMVALVEKYKLGGIIGTCSHATWRAATLRETGEDFTIKIIDHYILDPGKEIRNHGLMDHPHIIKLHETMEEGDSVAMILEHCAGRDLFEVICDRNWLDESLARRLFRQIIIGVSHCHACGVVHRDIKPENIMVDAAMNVKLTDFGLSTRIAEEGDVLSERVGSPDYAAPEMFCKVCEYTGPEVDVWSCGVVLYTMLCGELPFDQERIENLMRRTTPREYLMPEHGSDAAKDLISQIFDSDPLTRITIAEILRHEWFLDNRGADEG